jgi:hypothetical protein
MSSSRASWPSPWPLGLAVAVLLAAGGAWGQTTWTKYEGNPVLERGAPGEWDEGLVDHLEVLFDGVTYHMWYNGGLVLHQNDIGYATAPLPFPAAPLLLNGGRFMVESTWWTTAWETGSGAPYPITADSGAFTFFDPANIEVLVKVLDGCAINQSYWVFVAGLTDLWVGLTVTDTETLETKIYSNTAGVPFAPVLDTDAFALCE